MMSGMFWHNNFAPSVQIDSLLSEQDITLQKLMDAEDILQECKSQNKKLIEYLTRSDILEELVNLITEEPSPDLEERWRYKYSNVACELLTCDVPILIEKLAGNEMLLAKLNSFIDKEQPLNPLLASFYSKTLHALLRRASDQNWYSHQFVCVQTVESLKNHKNCVDLLLQHIQTSAIMDLILILLTKIESDDMRQNILKWLDDQKLIQRLVKLLSPSSDSEKHTNASYLLCQIVISPRMDIEKWFDPILHTVHSDKTITLILDTILSGEKLESSVLGGVKVLVNLLGQKESKTTESSETYGDSFNNIVKDELREQFALVIIPYLDKLNQLLIDPPEKPAVKTTAGYLEKPFGHTRLYILKLYVKLLSTENPKVFEKFAELNTFNILFDLFFQYSWNNFLHTEVQQCLSLVINCDCPDINEIMYSHIFIKSKLINRILEAWENNDNNTLNQQNGIRQGYMGHLIIIANEIDTRCGESNVLSSFLKTNLDEDTMQKWENFVSLKLSEIIKKQQLTLGEPPEAYMMSSSNSNEYASFPQDSYGQELCNSFPDVSTLPAFVDGDYNFRMKKFDDRDDNWQNDFNYDTFDASEDSYEKRQEIFNKVCDEKSKDIDDQNTKEMDEEKPYWLSKLKHDNSSSSDEEDFDDMCLEEETADPWNSMKPLSEPGATPINLWKNDVPEPVEQTGWANFDNINSEFSTDTNFQSKPCNEAKAELPEVPIVNENISIPDNDIGSNLKGSNNKENINKADDVESKTEETNVSSVPKSDSIETSINIPDSNANLTVIENRTSESKDVNTILEASSPNISETSSENLTNIETVTSATDNECPIATADSEPSQ